MHIRICINFVIISLTILFVSATLLPPKKGERSKAAKELKVNKGPVEQNVFDRNLVEDEPFAKDIIIESGTYYKDTKVRLFSGPTLGFLTPVRNRYQIFFF